MNTIAQERKLHPVILDVDSMILDMGNTAVKKKAHRAITTKHEGLAGSIQTLFANNLQHQPHE